MMTLIEEGIKNKIEIIKKNKGESKKEYYFNTPLIHFYSDLDLKTIFF
jgi:hypothetical protein